MIESSSHCALIKNVHNNPIPSPTTWERVRVRAPKKLTTHTFIFTLLWGLCRNCHSEAKPRNLFFVHG